MSMNDKITRDFVGFLDGSTWSATWLHDKELVQILDDQAANLTRIVRDAREKTEAARQDRDLTATQRRRRAIHISTQSIEEMAAAIVQPRRRLDVIVSALADSLEQAELARKQFQANLKIALTALGSAETD